MASHKLKRLAWLFLPFLLGSIIFATLFWQFPQWTKAQSVLEIDVSPTETAVTPGETINFSILLTNTGAISLTNFTIRSEQLGACNSNPIYIVKNNPYYFGPLILEPGEAYEYVCPQALYEDVQDKLIFSAETTAGDPLTSEEVAVAIAVQHLAANFATETQSAAYGDAALLTLFITNTGSLNLTDISVTPADVLLADCARTAGEIIHLAGGESTSFSCNTPNLFEDSEVRFNIEGTLDGRMTVSEIAYLALDVVNGVTLEISPTEQQIPANTATTLTVTLRNQDNLSTSDLMVTTADFPDCDRAVGTLAGGTSYQFQCETPKLTTNQSYILTASGTNNNLLVTAVAQTSINAASQIAIAVSPDNLIIAENSPVTFTITVSNNLTETLTNVAVNTASTQLGRPSGTVTSCTRSLGNLAPNASYTYTCEGTAVPNQPNQSFTLSGYTAAARADADENYHLAQAEANIGLAHTYLPLIMNQYQRPYTLPDLTITSVAASQISNDRYSLTIVVKNPSTLAMTPGNNFFVNAYLTSNLNSPIFVCSVQGEWLAAGDSYTCAGQITLTSGSHVIRAWADPYGNVVEEYEMNNTRDLEITHE